MNTDYILNGKLSKVWLHFVLASVVGVVLNAVYTMVDGIFVGRGTGEAGLAGVNLAWPAVTVILGIGLLLGGGASSLIAIALGQDDKAYAERILATTIKLSLIIGVVLMVLGFIFADPLTAFLGASPDTFSHTKDYFIVVYLMAIPYLLANSLNPLVRAAGNPHLSMIMVGVGAIANIILDWLFVIVLDLGTGGAALATGAGVILSSFVGLHYFVSDKATIRLRKAYFKIDKGIVIALVKVGFVSFMIQLSIGIVILIQNKVIYTHGSTSDVAIFCVAGYIISLYTQLCVGISQGMQPLIGYHFGAQKLSRMRKLLLCTLTVSVSIGILSLVLLYFFGTQLIALYGISSDIQALAYDYTMIFCMGAPFIGIVYTMSAYYQALGHNVAANVISISRGLILQVTFSLLLPPLIGVKGIFYAQSLSDCSSVIIVIVVCSTTYFLNHYKNKRLTSGYNH